jgi:N-methylhydantoinase A
MLMTDLRHDYIRTRVTPLNATTAGTLQGIINEMRTEGKAQLVEERVAPKDMAFEVFFDVRYAGQEHTVATPVGADIESEGALQEIEKSFHDLHFKAYTFRLKDPLEVVNVRVSAIGRVRRASLTKLSRQRKRAKSKGKRKIRLDESGPALVPVYERDDIPVGATIKGPAIVEEPTSTTIVRKGNKLTHEAYGNLIIEV